MECGVMNCVSLARKPVRNEQYPGSRRMGSDHCCMYPCTVRLLMSMRKYASIQFSCLLRATCFPTLGLGAPGGLIHTKTALVHVGARQSAPCFLVGVAHLRPSTIVIGAASPVCYFCPRFAIRSKELQHGGCRGASVGSVC